PAQQKKPLAVLRHVVKEFPPGRQYDEAQANEIIGRFHADATTLRREMIGFKLTHRADGRYWRTSETEGD
ncbi:MAG: DUF2087 domain-containing protein, partial [Chloroflexi bacterium]|nr:DUF2087 domain-containing protein [Chloroflexota bacterium]